MFTELVVEAAGALVSDGPFNTFLAYMLKGSAGVDCKV